MTIASGDFLAPARASLEEFGDEGVKVFYKPPGKVEKFGGRAAQQVLRAQTGAGLTRSGLMCAGTYGARAG